MRDEFKYSWLKPDPKPLRGDRYIAACFGLVVAFWVCVLLVLR